MVSWQDWVGRIVYIKLLDGREFTYSLILTYEEPFISITDKFGKPVIINTSKIEIIKEDRELKGGNK